MPQTSTTYYVSDPVSRRERRRDACEQASPEAARVLAVVRRTQDEVRAGEAGILAQAVEWARLHEVTDLDDAATWGDTPLAIAGEGAPLVSEFCLAEFAAAVGMKTEGGRSFIAHALELAHRLPYLYARLLVGAVPVWRARRIAEQTLVLSAEAAAYIDVEIAPVADKIGPVVTERLVEEAISRFMPDYARELAEQAEERRHVTVDKRQVGFHGTSRIYAELDLADALDLDQALARGAAHLKEQGSTDSLDIRRAQALGNLARGESAGSDLTLYVHLEPGGAHATVENSGTHSVAVEQATTAPGAAEVTARSLASLTGPQGGVGAQSRRTARLKAWRGAARHSRAPRRSRGDTARPLAEVALGDGPAQATTGATPNTHHRLKTHGGWTYTTIQPGTYLWRSPFGYHYLRDANGGTTDVTPRPVDPPGG